MGLSRSVYMGIPSLDLSYPSGYFKGLCRCGFKTLTFPLVLLNAVCQPISLLTPYDGSSRTFGSRLIMDGWQWSRFWC